MADGERCDCLNRCGDDERVALYQVEPCDFRIQCAKWKRAELARLVSLYEDANRWRQLQGETTCKPSN